MKSIIISIITTSLVVGFLFSQNANGQNQTEYISPCTTQEASQFDFWVGEWNLTWGDSGKGTNIITKDYGNCVIKEEFDGSPSMSFKGMSVSVFNPKKNIWEQTWVDNSGGYMDFAGGFKNGEMELRMENTIKGVEVINRMVFFNISTNDFDWRWEKSIDKGKTWQSLWQIHYQRKVK